MPLFWLFPILNFTSKQVQSKAYAGICAAAFFVGSCWMNFIGFRLSFSAPFAALIFITVSTTASSLPAVYSAGVSSSLICDKINRKKITAAVTAAAICLALLFPSFERPFAFYRFCGSVFIPMSVIWISDTFLRKVLKKRSSEENEDTRQTLNLLLWLFGFLLCRIFCSAGLRTGSIVPVIAILIAAWLAAHRAEIRFSVWAALRQKNGAKIKTETEADTGSKAETGNRADSESETEHASTRSAAVNAILMSSSSGAPSASGTGTITESKADSGAKSNTKKFEAAQPVNTIKNRINQRIIYLKKESDMNNIREKLRLYAVTDSSRLFGHTLPQAVEECIRGGATLVQLREKHMGDAELLQLAKEVKQITDKYDIPLIINDRPDIASLCGAAGVHIGQEDGSIEEARRILGDEKIIGVSAHSIKEAVEAEKKGADYLGIGAVFPTSTKQDTIPITSQMLHDIQSSVNIPTVAIGGITAEKIAALKNTGIDGVAVVSAIFSEENPKTAAERIAAALDEAEIGLHPKNIFSDSTIRGAIFDVDGTILDSMPMWCSVGSRFLEKNGASAEEGIDRQMVSRTLQESAAIFSEIYGIPGTVPEIVAGMIDMVRDDYKNRLICKPGVEKVIQELYEKKIPMYIATATDREMIIAALSRLDLLKYFQGIITCGELGVPKTQPDIYIYAANELGTKPEETLVFEDVAHAVLSATQAGFPVVAIYDDESAARKDEIKASSKLYLDSYDDWPGISGF